jgi:hypothetical protein
MMMCVTALWSMVGCVQRTIHITSNPPGALVHLNDEEVGRTPVTVPFTFYGTYDVRMRADGYRPLWTKHKTDMPWWELPGPDLVAEVIPGNKSEQNWHFVLEPNVEGAAEGPVIDRALQLRAMLRQDGEIPTQK